MAKQSISVDLATQLLRLKQGAAVLCEYPVSTAKNGPGEARDSECTPRGRHIVRAKIGAGLPPGSVMVGRRPTGEICNEVLFHNHPDRDWILTRILWLSGTEVGKNRLGDVDTMQRFIYIHGSPEPVTLDTPSSHGCIRMANADVIDLFNRVAVGTEVIISEGDKS